MKLAIIGASTGQLPLCLKAKELGHTVICFAWENGAVCKDVVDKFFSISIFEKEKILEICRNEKVDGVLSNASDATAEVVSYIATELGVHGVDYCKFLEMKDKSIVRYKTSNVPFLAQVANEIIETNTTVSFPCVLKPVIGNSKKGVVFAKSSEDLVEAIKYAKSDSNCKIIVEQYIEGREVSVESISYEGNHQVIQITDKDSAGAPHFVELGHHQPSSLPTETISKIHKIIPDLLNAVGIDNGASHVEMKITDTGDVYLIEINPRGGGDNISNLLVQLSTGIDYLRCMIDVALGIYSGPVRVSKPSFAGIYYLCSQTSEKLNFFRNADGKPWLIRKDVHTYDLSVGTSNYDRNGWIIYMADHKVQIDE